MKKAFWFVDPFEKELDLKESRLQLENLQYDPVPIYVLHTASLPPDQTGMDLNEDWISKVSMEAKKILENLTQKPSIVFPFAGSLSEEIRSIEELAKENKIEIFFVKNKQKTSFEQFFLGSFAESLILNSKIPVFLFKSLKKTQSVLFPTDFSDGSFLVFQECVRNFEHQKPKITLYFQEPTTYEPIWGAGLTHLGGVWMPIPKLKTIDSESARFRNLAERFGIPIELIHGQNLQSISDGVLEVVKNGDFDLVGLSSQSSSLAAFFLGSIAKQVIRRSPINVFSFHKSN